MIATTTVRPRQQREQLRKTTIQTTIQHVAHLPVVDVDDATAAANCVSVGTNNEDSIVTMSSRQLVASTVGIPQGPTVNPIGHYDQKAQRSYPDVVRDNRSTHSIELIK